MRRALFFVVIVMGALVVLLSVINFIVSPSAMNQWSSWLTLVCGVGLVILGSWLAKRSQIR
jgi:predicted membrane protein